MLIARAEGTYAFSHLTLQEYLAALCIAGRDDYVDYTLRRTADEWWREVILLEAGYLSTQSKEKTTRVIKAIADAKTEPAPYHNLVLAAECVRDAGANRIVGDLETELRATATRVGGNRYKRAVRKSAYALHARDERRSRDQTAYRGGRGAGQDRRQPILDPAPWRTRVCTDPGGRVHDG